RPLLLQHAAGHGAELTVPVDLGDDPPQLTLLLEEPDPLPEIHEPFQRVSSRAPIILRDVWRPRRPSDPRNSMGGSECDISDWRPWRRTRCWTICKRCR